LGARRVQCAYCHQHGKAACCTECFYQISFHFFLFLFWPSLIPHREELCLAVHRSTERKSARGYAEIAETLKTTDYADDADGSWLASDTDALQIGPYFGAREATIFSKRRFPRANGYFLTWETQG
jgi:hypothetical protein